MKYSKFVLTVFAIMILMFVGYRSVEADEEASPINSIGSALSLAEYPLSAFAFHFKHERPDGGEDVLVGYMNLDLWVTHLEINGTVMMSFNDDPLPGIPFPESGVMRGVYTYVTGVVNDDDWRGFGSANYEILVPSDPIRILFYPDYVRRVLGLPGRSGSRLYVDGELVAGYSSYYSGYVLYLRLDRGFGPHTYEVRSSEGYVTARGQLDWLYRPLVPTEGPATGFFNIEMAGGVLVTRDSYVSMELSFDGHVYSEDKGRIVPAKVILMDMDEGGSFYIADEWEEAILFAVNDGELYEIERAESDDKDYYWNQFSPGSGKLILVVLGDEDEEFYFSFSRSGKG